MSSKQISRTRARLRRNRPGVRLTAEQKAEYLDLIERDFVAGDTAQEIAKKYGISTASIYRWLRERDKIQHEIDVEAVAPHFDIDATFKVLLEKPEGNSASTREALFQFLTGHVRQAGVNRGGV